MSGVFRGGEGGLVLLLVGVVLGPRGRGGDGYVNVAHVTSSITT
jgi:hypothetical protein